MPPRLPPVDDRERAELRRLYLAASQGTWTARTVPQTGEHRVFAVDASGGEWLLALPNRAADAALIAAARNALPRLFAEVDDLRRRRTIPVLGDVG